MKFMILNHVAINVPQGEAERVREFYGKKLGLKEIAPPKLEKPDVFEFIWFEIGNFFVHFRFVLPPLSEKTPESMLMKDEDKAHFAVEVENINQIRQEMEKQEVYIFETIPLEDRDRFMIKDPFGNAIEILELHKNQKKIKDPSSYVRFIAKNELPFEKMTEGVARRYFSDENITIANFQVKKEARIVEHAHPNEQLTYIIHGSIKITIQKQDYILKAGDLIFIPPHLPHAVEAIEDALAIDVFYPPRKDWLLGEDAYLKQDVHALK